MAKCRSMFVFVSGFRVDGNSCFGLPAECRDDSGGDGLLQEDGRRLPHGRRSASLLQDESQTAQRLLRLDRTATPNSAICRSNAWMCHSCPNRRLTGLALANSRGLPPPAPPGLNSVLRI